MMERMAKFARDGGDASGLGGRRDAGLMEQAIKMFDRNGDGRLDAAETARMLEFVRGHGR